MRHGVSQEAHKPVSRTKEHMQNVKDDEQPEAAAQSRMLAWNDRGAVHLPWAALQPWPKSFPKPKPHRYFML